MNTNIDGQADRQKERKQLECLPALQTQQMIFYPFPHASEFLCVCSRQLRVQWSTCSVGISVISHYSFSPECRWHEQPAGDQNTSPPFYKNLVTVETEIYYGSHFTLPCVSWLSHASTSHTILPRKLTAFSHCLLSLFVAEAGLNFWQSSENINSQARN